MYLNKFGHKPVSVDEFSHVPFVSQKPPLLPNVYSDGSFTHPTHPHYGLSTCATWWPQRHDEVHCEYEKDFAIVKQEATGLSASAA
eukprot:4299759-Karenia_brevis.AAC.1